jgi:hypothetical protein
MSAGGIVAFVLFVAGAAMFLVELWFRPWDMETFYKLIITDAVLFVIALVSAFLFRERSASERLRQRQGLD